MSVPINYISGHLDLTANRPNKQSRKEALDRWKADQKSGGTEQRELASGELNGIALKTTPQ